MCVEREVYKRKTAGCAVSTHQSVTQRTAPRPSAPSSAFTRVNLTMSAVPKAPKHAMKNVLKKRKASPTNLPPPTPTPQPDEASTANPTSPPPREEEVDVTYEETTEEEDGEDEEEDKQSPSETDTQHNNKLLQRA